MFRGLPTASLAVTQLFSNPYHFTVPAYQRPYSWTTDQAGQLLDDLTSAAGLSNGAPALPDYFLGAIVLLDPEMEGPQPPPAFSGPRVFQVVDGQQRIATLSILAAALRDIEDREPGQSRDQDLADRLDRMIRIERDERDISERQTRIKLSESEQALFERDVLRRGAKGADPDGPGGGLAAIYQCFVTGLESLSAEERHSLARYILDFCHVVVIITHDIDRAVAYFTVLNQRGLDLDRKDVLKAEILRGIPAAEITRGIFLWQRAQDKLGPHELDRLFSLLKYSHGSDRAQIIASARALVNEMGAMPFLDKVLMPMADALHRLSLFAVDPDVQKRPALLGALTSLSRLGKNDWVPPALLAMAQFEKDPDTASALLIEIERLAVLLRLKALGSEKRQRRFGEVIRDIKANPRKALTSGSFEIPREEQKTITYHLRDLHRRNAPLAKFILMRIEDEMAGTPMTMNPKDLTVEHVLPCRPAPTSAWRKLFPDNVERERCSASLGNLALVTPRQNDRAENKDFEQKVTIYREPVPGLPPLVSNAAILAAAAWLSADILARETAMLDVIGGLWRIDVQSLRAPTPVR